MNLDTFRKSFPIFENKTYLATCACGAQAVQVKEALMEFANTWNEEGPCWNDQWINQFYSLKERMAQFIHCDTTELAHSFSASVLLGGLMSALPFTKERNKIVTTDIEFAGIGQQWIAQRDIENVEVQFLESNKQNEIDLKQYEEAIDESTLLVSITHVNYENGFKQDIKSIIDIAHKKGAFVLVDSYQAVGVEPINVRDLNVDFWLGGCSKYLLGTPGSVFMYVKKELASSLTPSVIGWHSQKEPNYFNPSDSLHFAEGASRFESGTRAVPCIYPSNAGMKLIMDLGIDTIKSHVDSLTSYFMEEAKKQQLEILTPVDSFKRASLVAIRFQDPVAIEKSLRGKNIISAARGNGVRFAFHAYNNERDVEYTIQMLKNIK